MVTVRSVLDWRKADVTSIFKKGKKEDMTA